MIPVLLLPFLEIVNSGLKIYVLHLEATPPEQRAAQSEQINILWDQAFRPAIKATTGIDLPPLPGPERRKQDNPPVAPGLDRRQKTE